MRWWLLTIAVTLSSIAALTCLTWSSLPPLARYYLQPEVEAELARVLPSVTPRPSLLHSAGGHRAALTGRRLAVVRSAASAGPRGPDRCVSDSPNNTDLSCSHHRCGFFELATAQDAYDLLARLLALLSAGSSARKLEDDIHSPYSRTSICVGAPLLLHRCKDAVQVPDVRSEESVGKLRNFDSHHASIDQHSFNVWRVLAGPLGK
jgi:hypothetical protein